MLFKYQKEKVKKQKMCEQDRELDWVYTAYKILKTVKIINFILGVDNS